MACGLVTITFRDATLAKILSSTVDDPQARADWLYRGGIHSWLCIVTKPPPMLILALPRGSHRSFPRTQARTLSGYRKSRQSIVLCGSSRQGGECSMLGASRR